MEVYEYSDKTGQQHSEFLMHISTDSLTEPQNSISSMENNQMHSGTEPETQGLALERSEILEDIAQIRGMAEEISRCLHCVSVRLLLMSSAISLISAIISEFPRALS